MIQPRPGQRPSILRANQQQGNKQKKRASWSDDVLLYHNPRRDSNISLPASEGTTDDSNKSNDTNEFLLRTSTCQTNFLKRISDTSNSRDSKSTTNSSITLEWWRRRAWFRVSDLRLEHMRSILSHTAYKTFIFILTLILLFGGCLQYLFPKQADPVFDIIYMVTFVMLMLDILMMCYAVPMYFVFRPSVKRKEDGDEIGCLCCDFQIGSFLLWFDVISIVSLLTEISFINTTYNERQEIQVLINQYGIPVFWESTYPLSFSNAIIFTVVSRTARVARLLRIDFIGNLQSMIANLNGAIRSRKICKPLLRRTSKVSEEKKHDAASKIQRAWRVFVSSQDGGLQSIVGAFVSAGANRRANIPSHNFTTSIQSSSTSRKTGKQEEKLGMLVQSSNRDSLTKSKKRKKKKKSHIGSAMNEITMRRVAAGMMIAIVLAIFFTYMEFQSPNVVTIIAMHNTMTLLQDEDINTMQSHLEILTNIASESSTPSLCNYEFVDQNQNVELSSGNFCDIEALEAVRNLEKLHVIVCNIDNEVDRNCVGAISKSTFVFRHYARTLGVLSLIFTIFLLCLWIIGLLFFVGPVTTLVVIPIERMIRLLAMLVKDPLGYSKTKKYMTFMKEDDELAKNTMWTQASLHGMETSFLMSTILRIGSLMKVGFGSAGVEMIRSNLRKSSRTSISQGFGATVACIFMFCDIRGFTDSSECLNEEVFVFTNRIAAVVHSYCHAYGGSANKNIGDAFLLSWRLDQDPRDDKKFCANRKQADKALLSVVKICIALYHETFFLKGLSETSISALRTKFAERPPGNLVQLGFGLHAGKAVEGAIGSQRKLDATYLSEAVESSEKLESSTKKYGVNVLMSGEFYNLLHKSVKEKCRKIDDIYYSDDIDWDEQSNASGTEDKTRVRVQNHMSLHTFDMDIHALFTKNSLHSTSMTGPPASEIGKDEAVRSRQGSFRHSNDRQRSNSGVRNNSFMRRVSMFGGNVESSHLKSDRELLTPRTEVKRELEIPEGTLIYTPNVWTCDDIRTIRKRFTDEFYQRFHDGYSAYFSGDLTDAKNIFKAMVDDFQDGPSRHFLKKIKNSNDTPPPTIHFKGGR